MRSLRSVDGRGSRWGRGVSVTTAVLLALSLAGCAGDDEYGDAKALSLVAEFFDLLEVGDAEGASELLAGDLAITPGAAENDFYSEAIAHPSEAEIVESVGYDSFKVNVTVGFRLGNDPDPREVTVVVEEEAGQSRITGWLGTEAVQIGKTDAPGVLEVNGSLTLALQKDQELLLLPGLYSFEYVDETGLTTLDPTTPEESTFEIAFPFDEGVVAPELPEGIRVGFRSLVIEPQLRTDELPVTTG